MKISLSPLIPVFGLVALCSHSSAAITAPENYTLTIGTNISGGTTSWQSASNTMKTADADWTGAVATPLGNYITTSLLIGGASLGNGNANTNGTVYYRNAYGSSFPSSSGSDTWFLSNTLLGGGRTSTVSTSTRYLEFTMTAVSESFTVTGFTYDFLGANNNASGARDYSTNVYYSLDGGLSFLSLFGSDFTGSAAAQSNTGIINAGGVTDLTVNDSVIFRLMLDSNVSASDTAVAIKNIQLNGTVIPEPSTYALAAGVGLIGLFVIRRRKR